MTQITEYDYRTAQEGDARVRQDFLDSVNLEDAREFVREVKYDFTGEHFKKYPNYSENHKRKTLASTVDAGFLPRVFLRKKSDIVVFPRLFKVPFKFFLSILIDHEGYHAAQTTQRRKYEFRVAMGKSSFFEIPASPNVDYLRHLKEATAFMSQLQNSAKRQLPELTREILYERVVNEILRARNVKKLAPFAFQEERNLEQDLALLFCNPPRDLLSRQYFHQIINQLDEINIFIEEN
jgi:hypothetical protein